MSWLTKVNSKHCCCKTVHSCCFTVCFCFRLDIGISSLQTVVAPVLHCGRDGERELEQSGDSLTFTVNVEGYDYI